MKELNLELNISQLEQSKELYLLALITAYGHGRCQELAEALSYKYKLPIGVLFSDEAVAIHWCVLLPNGMTLDAYGINFKDTTEKRYSKYAEGQLTWKMLSYSEKIGCKKKKSLYLKALSDIRELFEKFEIFHEI